jgi:DNA-binding NarL/FixJ family response regulator
MKTRIIIADNHTLFRQGLAALLKEDAQFEVLDGVSNGKELQAALLQHSVDVILMDMIMPVMNGFAVMQYIKLAYPDIKCIAISMLDHNVAVSRALDAGALAYLLKSADIDEVKTAIRAVVKDGFHYNDLVNRIILQRVILKKPVVPASTHVYTELTSKEIAIIKYVSQELTTIEIGEKLCLSPRTVEGMRIHLAEKLHVKNGIGLVLYGVKAGIIEI